MSLCYNLYFIKNKKFDKNPQQGRAKVIPNLSWSKDDRFLNLIIITESD
jgi:hypothetical protein